MSARPPSAAPEPASRRLRAAVSAISRRDLRLASGLTLFVYVATHLLNHALGLISIVAAESALRIAVRIWQSKPGTLVLYGAAVLHVGLALRAIYEHRTLRLPPLELLRMVLGLGIPTLLIGHAVATRAAFELYGHPPDYAHVVWTLWHSGRQGLQIALLVPGWAHGCLGLNFAFGRRPWFVRLRPGLFGAALLLPTCAVLGFLSMLKEVELLARDPAWVSATVATANDAQNLALGHARDALLTLYFGLIGLVFAARLVRRVIEERRGRLISIAYPGRSVRVPRGWSILEASRTHRIPHVSICGGRGRCSTCRVRILAGADHCPLPDESERRTLARLGLPADTRLACQLRPLADVRVVPLLRAVGPAKLNALTMRAERELAVVRVGLQSASGGPELLAHDRLYALNCFSDVVGAATRAAGGLPVQFNGDHVIVVFGLEVGAAEGSRQALLAATDLDRRLQGLASRLERELGVHFEHAVQLHTGPAVVGTTGDRLLNTPTIVGSALDVVQRMAASDSPTGAADDVRADRRIAVSQNLFEAAGLDRRSVP